MANWLKSKETGQFIISVPRFKIEEYYAEYEVCIKCSQNMEWKVYKRYSDFRRLKDELAKRDDKYKTFFPPKKPFNHMSSSFLNERRQLLETYLNNIVSQCHLCLPRSLALFLQMDRYEIHGITTAMAKNFFAHGNTLLNSNKTFDISVLLIHSINQRMLSPAPTNQYQKKSEDFGNVLETIESLKKVKIVPNSICLNSSDNCYGTSNIKVTDLTFDLSIFTSVTDLELNSIEISNLRGLFKMHNTIERLQAHFCLKSIEDLLFADLAYKETSLEHLQRLDGPLRCATEVDLSNNSITHIDSSIVTLAQVQTLNLSHNQISDLHFMHYLTFLTDLDLSYNNLCELQARSLSNKLGSIKNFSIKGNRLTTLNIVDRMFSLEHLDVSENLLQDGISLISLCRLSCLESLVLEDNPICSLPDFLALIYDLFLDRYRSVKINGQFYRDIAVNARPCVESYRARMRLAIVSEVGSMTSMRDLFVEPSGPRIDRNTLTSVDVFEDELDTMLGNSALYNLLVYWFFVASGRGLSPKKLLWVTEVFPPSRCLRPLHVLLATGGTQSPNLLKFRLVKSIDAATKRSVVTIQPKVFVDLADEFRHMIIGAGKSFLRFDRAVDSRDLYLCNGTSSSVEAFICHLFHEDEGIAVHRDARIMHLNEEDRVEMMQRFVDLWRMDLSVSQWRNCEQVKMEMDEKSELLFISRSMVQIKNGFQMLLTVVVTREAIYLVDERIHDWPCFSKQPNLSDISSGNGCSPYTSSCGQFPFLRTNAYLLRQVEGCSEVPLSDDGGGLLHDLCPSFRCPVEVTFVAMHPLRLIFEHDSMRHQLCLIVNQQSEHSRPPLSSSVTDQLMTISKPTPSELPGHLRLLSSSCSEIRQCLSMTCPKLLSLAQSSPLEVLAQYRSIVPRSRDATVFGMLWTKFVHCETRELPGLVSITSQGVYVLHEVEEDEDSEVECCSDPEVDQPDSRASTLRIIFLGREHVSRVYVGLGHQWVTLLAEDHRLVLLARNRGLSKRIISWLREMSPDGVDTSNWTVEYGHQDGALEDLLCQIRKWSPCGNIEFVHYCSLEDVRFDPAMLQRSIDDKSDGIFSYAAVVTTGNIAIIQHNIGEYPTRQSALGTIEQPHRYPQYQVVAVVSLADCLQLQLPGHDRAVLILVIRARTSRGTATRNIRVSLTCQKEQRRLIDTLRYQRSQCFQGDFPLPVSVC